MPPLPKNNGSGLAVGLAAYVVGVNATVGVFTTDGVLATFGALYADTGDGAVMTIGLEQCHK